MRQVQRVLIVDDDDDDRELFCEAIGHVSKEIKCIHATDGEMALRLLRADDKSTPDYIFLDLNMPRLNGKECLAEIKKINKVKDVPVIIYSTSNHRKDMEDTQLLGAADFLHKPNEFDLLISSLKNIFSGSLRN